jgi:hypothetical protein
MPGNSIWDWLISPVASNDTADNLINWRENQDPSTVNNSARQMMGRIAEMLSDFACVPVSVTTGSAIAVTVASAFAANRAGLKVGFKLDVANAASPTLAVNGLTALPLLNADLAVPTAGSLVAGQFLEAVSSSTNWVLIGTTNFSSAKVGGWTNIAAAATVNLATAPTTGVNVTSTATITSFGTGANLIKFVAFASSGSILTYNATSLILPTAANITTAAGDMAGFISDASGNWTCVFYQRASGATLATVASYGPAGGRLTFTTATPILTTAVTGATSHFWTPYRGQSIPIYNGTIFTLTDMGGELTQTASDTTKSPAATAANSNYDIFAWNDSGTMRATRGPAWTSATARGTGAGTSELQLQNGIYLNKNSITNGPAALRGTYLGSIRSNASSTFDWNPGGAASGGTAALMSIWNNYNRIPTIGRCTDNGAPYTYATNTIRQARASTTNQVNFLVGLLEDAISAVYSVQITTAAAVGSEAWTGIGLDTITAITSPYAIAYNTSATAGKVGFATVMNMPVGTPGLGWHYAAAVETAVSGTIQFLPLGSNQLSVSFPQ